MSARARWLIDRASYPLPGAAAGRETSIAAADAIAERAPTLRELTLRAIQASEGGLTADEAADALGMSILSIRPRVTELARRGLVEDSGERRRNQSGKSAIVWREEKWNETNELFDCKTLSSSCARARQRPASSSA